MHLKTIRDKDYHVKARLLRGVTSHVVQQAVGLANFCSSARGDAHDDGRHCCLISMSVWDDASMWVTLQVPENEDSLSSTAPSLHRSHKQVGKRVHQAVLNQCE
eukprot:2511680-Pyramimonas_sp.AAC.1